jgi:MFS family permease
MPVLTDHERRAYEANIWKSYLFQFLLAFQLWWPIWVVYLTDYRGFSLTQVSVLEALFWVVIVIAEVPTGAVADRFGRKTSLVLSAVAFTGAVLVFGLAGNYWLVLVSYVLWGFQLSLQSGADSALVFESLKALGREREYQRVAGMGWGVFSAGALMGLLLGAPLAGWTDLRTPVLVSAATTGLALLVSLSFTEPPRPSGQQRIPYMQLFRAGAATAWRTPSVRLMIPLAALLLAAMNPAIVFGQPFLGRHDVSIEFFGLAQAPTRALAIVGALMAYRISGALGYRGTLGLAPLVVAGAYGLLAGWDSVYAFSGIAIVTMSNSILVPITGDYLNQRIPNNQRATILSMRQLCSSVLVASLQPSLGVIADEVGLAWVFWTSAAFSLAAIPIFFWWLRVDDERTPKVEADVDAAAVELPARTAAPGS